MLFIAHIRQRAGHVPRQERPTQTPEDCEEAVDGEVEARVQADEAVEEDREGQGGDAEEGGGCELGRDVSVLLQRSV